MHIKLTLEDELTLRELFNVGEYSSVALNPPKKGPAA